MDWSYDTNSRMPALQVQSPELKIPVPEKKKLLI
jgi:hypothetical protein